jgi:hypothetical protein
MTLSSSSIRLQNENPLLGNVEMGVLEITDSNSGNSITFQRLCYLQTGLASLEAPPNLTTLHIQDTILIDKLLNDVSNTLTNDNITISNSLTSESLVISNNNIINNSTVNNLTIQHIGGLDINIITDDNITITSAGEGNINLDAPNINSYGWAMPICLNLFDQNSYNYGAGGQVLQDVYQVAFNLPNQFFCNVPQSGYTATRWQINFDLNQFNMSDNSDKGFAMCFELWDSNSNIYSPFLYNQLTPFCRWNNSSQWSNGSFNNFSSVNWCDYVDLGAMAGTFDSNLTLHLFVAGNNPFTADFKMKMGLTRINRI